MTSANRVVELYHRRMADRIAGGRSSDIARQSMASSSKLSLIA
jgi:hypothetical protein